MKATDRLLLGLALPALLFGAGCGQRAPAQRELVVYTVLEDDELAVYTARWRREHPEIALKLVRDSTGIVAARLLAEKDAPVADVVWGVPLAPLYACDEAGLFEGYTPAGCARIAPTFRDAAHVPPHWVGIKVWMCAVACNTVELRRLNLPVPACWDDLTHARYAGSITAPNPASSGTGYALVCGFLQARGEAAGWAFLDRLHANVAQYTHSGSKPAKLAGTGEFPLGISFDTRIMKQRRDGEPLRAVFPLEGCGWEVEVNALIRKPALKPEARLFLDWALGDAIFADYAQFNRILAAPDVPSQVRDADYPADPRAVLSTNVNWVWASRERARILDEWGKRYGGKSEARK